MNAISGVRRRLAVIAAAVLLLVVAVAALGQGPVSARPGAPAPSAAAEASGGSTPSGGQENARTGQGRETSLEEAAGRRPAGQDRARIPQDPQGLAQAASKDPGDAVPGQARRSGPSDRARGLSERGPVRPEQALKDSTAPGGCLAEYGEDGQCLPAVPPSMAQHVADMKKAGLDPDSMDHSWGCAEVRTYFPDGITVRGSGDPQGLDANADGLACGAGD